MLRLLRQSVIAFLILSFSATSRATELERIVAIQQAEIQNLKQIVNSVIRGKTWIGDPTGLKGQDGKNGRDGRNGIDGAQGPQGVPGPAGSVSDLVLASCRSSGPGTYCEPSCPDGYRASQKIDVGSYYYFTGVKACYR